MVHQVQPIIKIHSNRGLLIFSVFCGRNFSRLIFLKFYFSNLSIHISYKSWYLWKMTRYRLDIFSICSEIIYECSGSSNSTTKTWYLFMDCDTSISGKKRVSANVFNRLSAGNQLIRKHRICIWFVQRSLPIEDQESHCQIDEREEAKQLLSWVS